MVIPHVQPLLLVLASLFFLPTLHGAVDVDFKYCNGIGYPSVNITRVQTETDIRIFGFTKRPLLEGTIVVAIKFGDSNIPIVFYDLCAGVVGVCPIIHDTSFSLFLYQALTYRGQYKHEKISVTLTNSRDPPLDGSEEEDVMCVYFNVPTSAVSA